MLASILFAVSTLLALPATAQVARLWTFDELRGASDLVVIARPEGTRDTGRRATHPDLTPAVPVIELETEFEVLTVLKADSGASVSGPAPGRRAIVHHYRLDLERWRRDNPAAPGQPPAGLVNAGSYLEFEVDAGPYLLFLKAREHGYAPTSGPTVPDASVFRLGEGMGRR